MNRMARSSSSQDTDGPDISPVQSRNSEARVAVLRDM